jgi:D-alanine-D-alanine ligase
MKEDELKEKLKKVRVAVLMGGTSAEREVSLRSGRAVMAALQSAGCQAVEVDVRDKEVALPPNVDVAFLALHGTGGEDGGVQSILEKREVAFTGSDSKASALAFDKVAAKKVFARAGLLTPPDMVMTKGASAAHNTTLRMEFPCVVKPSRQGSSIGIHIVRTPGEIVEALKDAYKSDDHVLVERFIAGGEYTVGILGEDTLPVIEIRPKSGWYDYGNKYTKGATEYLVPAPIDAELAKKLREAALKAHKVLGCRDMSRVDFRVNDRKECYILELNTIPGMTDTSLLPKAAAAAGISFPQMCMILVDKAFTRKKAKP